MVPKELEMNLPAWVVAHFVALQMVLVPVEERASVPAVQPDWAEHLRLKLLDFR